MIKIAETGNTIIQVATGGSEYGDQWTVYPYRVDDPTFEKLTPGQQNKAKELSITGRRGKEDLSGHLMQRDMAKAIVQLRNNLLDLEQYRELGLIVDRIDVDPEDEIAQILGTEYGIRQIEGQASTEKRG